MDGAFWVDHSLEWIALLALLGCSAFFSGSETALFNLSRAVRQELARSRHWPGRLVAELTQQPNILLHALLLGNMIVNVAFSAIAAVVVLDLHNLDKAPPAWAIGAITFVPLILLILFGEVMPKMLAFAVARQWSLASAVPLYVLIRVSRPILQLLDVAVIEPLTRIIAPRQAASSDISPEELSALMKLSAQRGVIDHDISDILREIVELTHVHVGDVMVPRVDMIAFDLNDDRETLLSLLQKTHLRRVPVYDGDLDNILGILHAKRVLLNPATPLRELIQPVTFVPQAGDLEKVLLQFRATRRQMAIVVDEYGGTAGLITLEDVLEEIVGDIPDYSEVGPPPQVETLSETQYRLPGNLLFRDWAAAFDIRFEQHRVSTVGGFVCALLGRIPQLGDTVDYRNLRFTVQSMQGRRIETLQLQLLQNDTKGGQA